MDVDARVDDLVDDAPVEPREGHLDVKARVFQSPWLREIDRTELLEWLEAFFTRVECVRQTNLVLLTLADESFKYVSVLKFAHLRQQVLRVQPYLVLVQVVYLDGADEAQVPLTNVSVGRVRRAHLKQAVQVAFVDDAEAPLRLPLEPRADQLKCLFVV